MSSFTTWQRTCGSRLTYQTYKPWSTKQVSVPWAPTSMCSVTAPKLSEILVVLTSTTTVGWLSLGRRSSGSKLPMWSAKKPRKFSLQRSQSLTSWQKSRASMCSCPSVKMRSWYSVVVVKGLGLRVTKVGHFYSMHLKSAKRLKFCLRNIRELSASIKGSPSRS